MALFKQIRTVNIKIIAVGLRKKRISNKISLRDLAAKAGISPSTLSDIERKVTFTTQETSNKIESAINLLIEKKSN